MRIANQHSRPNSTMNSAVAGPLCSMQQENMHDERPHLMNSACYSSKLTMSYVLGLR
jgi:hypothetical protein